MGHEFRFTDHLAGAEHDALLWTTRIGGREIEGVDLVREDAQGRLLEIRVFMRPLDAAQQWREAMRLRRSP
jgi:hypothetical protein